MSKSYRKPEHERTLLMVLALAEVVSAAVWLHFCVNKFINRWFGFIH